MGLVARLKSKVAVYFADRVVVQRLVAERLLKDRRHLRAAAARMATDPEVVGDLVKNKELFEAVLARLSANPEALFQLLSTKAASAQLWSQQKVLTAIATNPRSLSVVLKAVPKSQRADALDLLLANDVQAIKALGDTPAAVALALALDDVSPTAAPAVEQAFVKGILAMLGDHAPPLLLRTLEETPDAVEAFLTSNRIREVLFERLSANPKWLLELMVLSTSQLSAGNRPAARIRLLLEDFMREPVFRFAMQKDADLRAMLLDVVQLGYESAGQNVVAALERADARAGQNA